MRIAVYVRVSGHRQVQTQTIEQQLERLHRHCQEQGWPWQEVQIFRDDCYSGASLKRPRLDRLRDQAAGAGFDLVLIPVPDRLARKYVHQMLLLEELERVSCRVEFVDRPMSQDPHDQLLLQIRGAVAKYERTLIADCMRRGRQQKFRAGTQKWRYFWAIFWNFADLSASTTLVVSRKQISLKPLDEPIAFSLTAIELFLSVGL